MFFSMVYTYSKGPTSMKHCRNHDLLSAFTIETTQICKLGFGDLPFIQYEDHPAKSLQSYFLKGSGGFPCQI